MKKLETNKKGISLVEVILTVAIFAIIIPVIYSIFFVGTKSFETSRDIGLVQQDVRNISNFINSELRNIDKITIAVTDFSGENYTGVYYSMEFSEDNSLVRKKYINDPTKPEEERIIATSTADDPINISIKNTEEGKINVIVGKNLNGQEYGVDFDVRLENNRILKTDIEISSNKNPIDGSENKFYYSFPGDSINNEEATQ